MSDSARVKDDSTTKWGVSQMLDLNRDPNILSSSLCMEALKTFGSLQRKRPRFWPRTEMGTFTTQFINCKKGIQAC